VHVHGLKFASTLSPVSLISADGGVANEGSCKCPMALRAVGRGLELELIQTHMAQKPMLRVEVCARCVARESTRKSGWFGWAGMRARLKVLSDHPIGRKKTSVNYIFVFDNVWL
jgi:hypothetical protein